MLYHLFQYLDRSYDLPGAGMFQYISFRSALAVILALLITITFGQGIIRFMQRRQIGEEIRNLGLEGQLQKRGTPTMGGVMILFGRAGSRATVRPAGQHLHSVDDRFDRLAGAAGLPGRLHQGLPPQQGGAQRQVQDRGTGGHRHHRRHGDVRFARSRGARQGGRTPSSSSSWTTTAR